MSDTHELLTTKEPTRALELEYCLRELWGMIERRELVRNTSADGNADWYERMLKTVAVLKRTQDVLRMGEK